ncbi:hypothetical protein BAE44_0019123 [Dichanthelium oligosanthes]|uniref:F-box protein At3g26010-like beta-propeller domain-containing protein n=1 Tax=Dichanthelium oligosanthes TaxID=888268 RepID=A0A1E5V437_9POAL|nr:hypothetical protein BAE44_0019123 [Dichanthelium oligosanthes]
MEGDSRLPNDALVEVIPTRKPLRDRSRFIASTARREIHGGALQRTELPPTLKGFFFFSGRSDDESDDEDEPPLNFELPPKRYGQFANLLPRSAAPLVDIDPSFSFLTKALPKIDYIYLLDSRNGLLLFGHLEDARNTLETCYIVCNPSTEQWVAVPGCGKIDESRNRSSNTMHTYLLFDPAASSHFHIILFWEEHEDDDQVTITAQAYSSETGEWSSEDDWSEEERQGQREQWRIRNAHDISRDIHYDSPGAMVNGMLYLIYAGNGILQVDAQGKTRAIIPAPGVYQHQVPDHFSNIVLFIGQSQGHLHCIIQEGHGEVVKLPYRCQLGEVQMDAYDMKWREHGLSFWVLQDPDTQEWVLKGRLNYLEQFGDESDLCVAAMHQDCNLVFLVQCWDAQMISYDIDRREFRAVDADLKDGFDFTPYVPYSSELFLGVIGAHR